jgi:hypothetical protein
MESIWSPWAHRAGRLAARLACGVIVCVAGASARGGDTAVLILTDACAEAGRPEFEIALMLVGEEERPSSLKTTVFYDTAVMNPFSRDPGREIEPAYIGGTSVAAFTDVDPDAGRIDLVFHTEGRLPVLPIPAGVLARLHFRLTPLAPRHGILRVDLDPGETVSLDGRGAQMFTATGGPGYVVVGRSGPGILVSGNGARTILESYGELLRGRGWIVRGRIRQVDRASGPRLGPLEVLAEGEGTVRAIDTAIPEPGDGFFYLIAQQDAAGRMSHGFASDCRSRWAPSP